MVNASVKTQALMRGVRLTERRGTGRVRKTDAALRREIREHDDEILASRAAQAKGVMTMCQALMNVRGPPPAPRAPPPPPMFKAPPAKKAPSPPKKLSMLDELKATLNKKGLKERFNKNAKKTVA